MRKYHCFKLFEIELEEDVLTFIFGKINVTEL